jgi:hypothetical protein
MEKMGYIAVLSYMGYDEFEYGIYEDEIYKTRSRSVGKKLGRTSEIGQKSFQAIKEAEDKLKNAGCTHYRIIPLNLSEVITYEL